MNLTFEWKKEHDGPTVWKLIDNSPDACPRELASVLAGKFSAVWRSSLLLRSGEEQNVALAKRKVERLIGIDKFMRDNEREVMEWKVRQCWQPARHEWPEGPPTAYPANAPHLMLGGPLHMQSVPMWRLGHIVVPVLDKAALYTYRPDPLAAPPITEYRYHPQLHVYACDGTALGALRVGVVEGTSAWDVSKMLRNPDILEAIRAIEC